MTDPITEPLGNLPRSLGLEMTRWQEGFAELELEASEAHLNRHGLPHGGLYCTMLDTAMGYSGVWTGDAERRLMAMTLTLTTSFLSRPKGTRLIVSGRKTGGGRSTFFAEGQVHCSEGILIATGSGAFRYRAETS